MILRVIKIIAVNPLSDAMITIFSVYSNVDSYMGTFCFLGYKVCVPKSNTTKSPQYQVHCKL